MSRLRRSGFTLIELLIVVVIIGILASIAIPKFKATKGKANFAALKSDLKNISTAEESYFYDHQTYTDILDSLAFKPSHGVTLTITAGATGWGATAQHPDSWPHTCALFLGTAVTSMGPATVEGQITCN